VVRARSPRGDLALTTLALGEAGEVVSLPSIPRPGPVGGRLKLFSGAWDVTCRDTWVKEVLRKGLTFNWKIRPSIRRTSWFFQPPKDKVKFDRLLKEVDDLLAKRAIIEVPRDTPGWYSLVFLVPKKTGTFRPVFDLSQLNRHLVIPKFRMESAITIMRSLKKGDWVVSVDVKDAYLHVPIQQSFQKFLLFALLGKVYKFLVLPFGIATAPYVFTRIVGAMADVIHLKGVRFHHYLDDWLIVADSACQVKQAAEFVLKLAISLGWLPNWEKSMLTPTQTVVHVGIEYDLRLGLAFPPRARLEKLGEAAIPLLGNLSCTARQVLSLIGLIASMEKQVPYGRCFLRPLQWGLALQWRISRDHLDQKVLMTREMKETLSWWLDIHNTRVGKPLEQFAPDLQMFTDASQIAWGAHMNERQVSRLWSLEDKSLHINVLELKAVTYAYEMWSHHYGPGTKWLVFSDNTTVVAHINKQGGTRSRALSLEAEKLIRLAIVKGHFIKARHIPGKRNVWADQLSRPTKILGTEWSLCHRVFRTIREVFFDPQIDLFATSVNKKVQVFYSPLPESTALGTDAMSHPWDGMWAYAYPPTGFIREVLRKMQTSNCELLLVAPAWPTQAWYPLLLSLLVDEPRSLPVKENLLKQPGTNFFHKNPGMLRLHVWRLSNDRSRRLAFLDKCPDTSLERIGLPPIQYMKPSGAYTPVGVLDGRLIRARPL